MDVRVTQNFHRIWNAMEKSLVKRAPGPKIIRDLHQWPTRSRSDVYIFADETNIFTVNDKDILRSDLTNLMNWSGKWLLSFHHDKCKHIHITRERGNQTGHRYCLIQGIDLELIKNETDIGVHIDQNIYFDKHIDAISNKANAMFAMLRRASQYIDKETFIPLYKTLGRTHLDYASSVYSPFKQKHVD